MPLPSQQKRIRPSDRIGQRFNRLVVQGVARAGRRSYLSCICDCGNTTVVEVWKLRSGRVKSCGCLIKEIRLIARRTHGKCYSPEYIVRQGMIYRCHNPKSARYCHYGARGITVCERWRHSFAAFLEDMGPRPTPQHKLERRDNNSGYSPSNCCWATQTEQMRNTRSNRMLSHNGETRPAVEWSEITGLKYSMIMDRLDSGWSVAEALTLPPMPWKKRRGASSNGTQSEMAPKNI